MHVSIVTYTLGNSNVGITLLCARVNRRYTETTIFLNTGYIVAQKYEYEHR